MDDERCHVTIVGTRRRVDLAVPAHAAIAEYTPALLKLCGQVGADDTFPPAWSLALPGARPFAPESSLGEFGVVDGATLYLRDAAAGEFDEPVVTDLEELVEEANQGGRYWSVRRRAQTTVTLSILGLIAGFAVLVGAQPAQPGIGVGAIIAGFGLAMTGWHGTRRRWPIHLALRLIMVLSAVPLLALAAASLPAARADGGRTLIALSLGAVVGALAARLALSHVTTLIAVALTMLAVPVTVPLAAGHASVAEAAGVVSVVLLAVLGVAPKAAGHLAALAVPQQDGATPALPEEEIAHLVSRGRRVLVGINVLCSLLMGGCLVVLGTTDQSYAIALAACMGLALILRSGQLKAMAAVLPVAIAGVVGLATAVIHAPSYANSDVPGWTGAAVLVAAGVLALGAGLALAFRPDAEVERPAWLGSLTAFVALVCVPLAVGVFGVFESMMHMGESL